MSEVWVRLALVVGGLVVASAVVVAMRAIERRQPKAIDAHELAAGVFLFSSGTCLDCVPSRERLLAALGPNGFVEVKWEEEPERFRRLGIDTVPATVVVSADGSAKLFAGVPKDVDNWLGP
jgi:hypothetical protein